MPKKYATRRCRICDAFPVLTKLLLTTANLSLTSKSIPHQKLQLLFENFELLFLVIRI